MQLNERERFGIPTDWSVERVDTTEKERINQSVTETQFTAISKDGRVKRTFVLTGFCDHRGSKKSWKETTYD
jgi:hypothetical protein